MNPYKLSTDYKRLFDLISKGYEIACWVDYEECRDVAKALRFEYANDESNPIDIEVQVRGIRYGGVSTWKAKRRQMSVEQLFTEMCQRLKLEYIDPENV